MLSNVSNYNLQTRTWVEGSTPNLKVARSHFGLACDTNAASGGVIYAVGGTNLETYSNDENGIAGSYDLGSVEMLDTARLETGWVMVAPLNLPRHGLSVAIASGFLFAIGGGMETIGSLPAQVVQTVEVLDLTATSAARMTPPSRRRRKRRQGRNDKDGAEAGWIFSPPLNIPRVYAVAAAVAGGKVCVFGGGARGGEHQWSWVEATNTSECTSI